MNMMRNKKGQTLSKSAIVFIFIIFYAILTVFVGLISNYFGIVSGVTTASTTCTWWGCDVLDVLGNIITGYAILPVWLNIILFGTMTITLTFIIVTSLPTFNGGS
jgi:hypothetical protein